ncbi:histone-fold-containing protein [Emericellopsis atlantica]|uniref:DNA polymerase epsilon subunit D n=1 Tax=Emericellopsis atlantica TaxID=2614577 RepID=A0A9P7ZP81_9HYPO|nr:histone-fold-containing protein [Emericellopsis atlantica]KAG9255153.1 histone-fold-containing protein [Emericellopsis atlantica]
MPPRKSDPAGPAAPRKSDVSTARFALKDDVQEATPSQSDQSAPAHVEPAPTTAPAAAAGTPTESHQEGGEKRDKDTYAIEDLSLPKSIITRLAKGVLPPNTQIQANAVLAMSKSTTVFVNYLASYANEHTVNANKKTISPADVFKALEDTEFGFLRARVEAEFAKFNQIQTEKRTSYRAKVKASKGAPTGSADVSMTQPGGGGGEDSTISLPEQHTSKKPRVDPTVSAPEEHEDDAETEDEAPVPEDDDDDDDVPEDEDNDEDETRAESADEMRLDDGDEVKRAQRDEALDGEESD